MTIQTPEQIATDSLSDRGKFAEIIREDAWALIRDAIVADRAQQEPVLIDHEQAREWAGFDVDMHALAECIANSSIPDAIATIAEQLRPAAYGFQDWVSDAEYGGDPDKFFLTIVNPDGDEYALIGHRTCDGKYPLDGDVAQEKIANAQRIVDALNAQEVSA